MSEEVKYIGKYKVVEYPTGKGYEHCIQYDDDYYYDVSSCTKFWYKDGRFHRLDGPAIEWSDGDKRWCVEGNRHRLDGPAVEYANGCVEYWYNGKRLDKKYKPPAELSGKEAVDYLLKLQLLK